jgi:Bacterial Ig domain
MRAVWLVLLLPILVACPRTREPAQIQTVTERCLFTQAPNISKTQIKLGQTVTFSLSTQSEYLNSIETLPIKVSFLIQDRVIGEDTTQPYTFVWTPKAGDPSLPTAGSVDLPVFVRTSFVDPKCDATVGSNKLLTVVVTDPQTQP